MRGFESDVMQIPTDGIPPEPASPRRPRRVAVLLVLLPAWLVISGVGALWYYFVHEEKMERESQARFARAVSESVLADDLGKIVELIGERNSSSPQAEGNLNRVASMIEGTLGPSNTGYAIRREQGPAAWPLLIATLEGTSKSLPAVWVVTSYDSPPGSVGGEANASGLVSTIAAAQAVANDKPAAAIHFAFLPHANDPEAPVVDAAAKLARLAGSAEGNPIILTVEAMGAGDTLWLSSRDVSARPLGLAQGLGEIYGAEVVCLDDDTDLASILFEMDLPAVRVATRAMLAPDEADDITPSAATVAASTGRLIELIRRCATPPE